MRYRRRNVGYRTEELYGEGYRDAASVMAHETFQLENTDILDTLSATYFKNTEFGRILERFSKVISGEIIMDEKIEHFLDEAFEHEEKGIKFFRKILEELKKKTGKEIKYVLWLCDTIEDVIDSYETENTNNIFTEFDVYKKSKIVLSDLGQEGKLFGYEEEPKVCGYITLK